MAFTMKHGLGPFRQEETKPEAIKPEETKSARYTDPGQEPNWADKKYDGQGSRMVSVFQGKPRDRVLNAEIENIKAKAGDYQFTGDVSTQEGYTRRSGSAINNFFTGEGYSVTKDYGSANTLASALGPKFETSEQKDEFYDNLKNTLREGKGATIVNGQITSGGDHQREEKYSLRGAAKREFYDARNNFNKQKNADALAEKQTAAAAKRAERNALLEAKKAENAKLQEAKNLASNERAKANADKIAAYRAAVEAKKNGGKKPVEETQPATNEPVAQQNRSAFYQKGMIGDKMALENKNKKASATSPLEQEKNSNTGEKLVGTKTTVEKGLLGTRPGTFTTITNDYKTPGNNNVSTGEKMSNADWAKFVKENPNRNQGSNRSDSNKSFKPDLEKPMDLPKPAPTTFGNGLTSQPIKPIPVTVTPTEKPKPEGFSTNTHFVKNKGKEGKSGGGSGGGGSAKKYGCPNGCP